MYKVDVRVDGKEAAAIDRRRIQEYQRQSRIFNAKQRLIGVRVSGTGPMLLCFPRTLAAFNLFLPILSSSFILIYWCLVYRSCRQIRYA